MCFAAYFLLHFFIGCAYGQLFLSPDMTEAERYVNEPFIVKCDGATANTTWVSPSGQPIKNNNGSVHVERGPGESATLVFESISKNNRGNYTCSGHVNGQLEKISFKLIVVKPITFSGTSEEQNVTETSSVFIKCEVNGDPQPTVMWQFKGKPIPQDPRFLTMPRGLYIQNSSLEDEGVYYCRAYQLTAKTSNLESRAIKLSVQYKPRWNQSNKSERDKAYGYMGGIANLTCHAHARPAATYDWTRNNESVDASSANIIFERGYSVLQVSMYNSSVLGDYECTAKNILGEIRKVIELAKGDKPSPPRHVALSAVGAQSAQFNLHASSREQVIGYRIQFVRRAAKVPIDQGDYQDVYTKNGPPYTLIHLTPNTEYSYRVAARNAAGISDYSPSQRFTTHEITAAAYSLQSSLVIPLVITSILRTV